MRDKCVAEKLDLIKRFGHIGDAHFALGINGKQDELNAAMGNVNINHIAEIIATRKHISELYDELLIGRVQRPQMQEGLEYNYAYYPVVFENEQALVAAFDRLAKLDIYPRRYFYPSLNMLPYLKETCSCPISEDICSRIACLPLFVGLTDEQVCMIAENI